MEWLQLRIRERKQMLSVHSPPQHPSFYIGEIWIWCIDYSVDEELAQCHIQRVFGHWSMAQCLDRGQRQVESILGSALLNVFISDTSVTHQGELSTSSASLHVTPNYSWQNWRMGCHPEGQGQAQEPGPCSPEEAQKGQVQGTMPGSGHLRISTGWGMQGLGATL